MDCDLREPVQHLIFEADGSAGLTTVLAGEDKLVDALLPTAVPGLHLLPCGPVPANPSELLASKRFQLLLHALCATFDRVIIDSPPLLTVTDACVLSASADATLLVLRMNQSMRTPTALALDALDKVGARVLGAIANDVPVGRSYGYYRGGSWHYAASARRLLASTAGTNGDGAGEDHREHNGNGDKPSNGDRHGARRQRRRGSGGEERG